MPKKINIIKLIDDKRIISHDKMGIFEILEIVR